MLVECVLGRSDSGGEIVVVKGWIDDLVAVLFEVGRFNTTGNRMPTVEEKGRDHLRSGLPRMSEWDSPHTGTIAGITVAYVSTVLEI